MTHRHELSDLRKTNDRAAHKRARLDDFHQRTQKRRDRRRQLALICAGIGRGWMGR